MSLENDEEYRKLKDTHKRFISHLLSGKNATESYSLVFPNASRATAGQHGWKLKDKYKELIAKWTPIPSVALERVASQTLENLTLMAFADVADMVDKDGKPKALSDIPKPLRMAITEVEIDGDRVKYKVGGKAKALELLAKISRITNDQPQVEITMISEEERQSRLKEIVVKALQREEEES